MPAPLVTRLVHITLDQELLDDPPRLRALVERLRAEAGVMATNPKRLSRHGILTGWIEIAKMAAARGIKGVVSVETDTDRNAI